MSIDIYGISPIAMRIWLEYVAWLLEKGADFYAKQDLILYHGYSEVECLPVSWQPFGAAAWHFVAGKLGASLNPHGDKSLEAWLEKIPPGVSKTTLQRIITDEVSDACLCACSISGCKVLTITTKSYLRSGYWREKSPHSVGLWASVKSFCDPLKISEFLRIMTFEELDITYTCCCHNRCDEVWMIKDKAEIDEIRDEEVEDLQKLEELLEEFEAKRKEIDIPFEDFIKEYWRPRMKEVLEEGTLDEDALREIGVEVY